MVADMSVPTAHGTPIQLRTVYEVQQDLATASTLSSQVVWDVLGPDQADVLKSKLACLYPDDTRACTTKQELRSIRRRNHDAAKIRSKLFHNIWQQRRFSNGVLLHSIIYVIVAKEESVEKAKFSHDYTVHPIFRTRRCQNSNSSNGCCMIFIDEQARVYQNWNDFVENNELPPGTMVAPARGCYSLDADSVVSS